MRILVTGADGQLGCCLRDRLTATAHEWLALNRDAMDITDPIAVRSRIDEFRPDVIVNAAAYTRVDRAETEPVEAYRINATAVGYLAMAAGSVGAMLVQISTDYVFDGNATEPYRESDPVRPLGVYGASKLAGEKAAAEAERYLVIRAAWLFSEYGNNFLKTMLRLGLEREELRVVADQFGTPTYAGDLSVAVLDAVEKAIPSGIYHFSGGKVSSWYDFARAIFQQLHTLNVGMKVPTLISVRTKDYPTSAKRPAHSVLDDAKLNNALARSTGDWEEALSNVISKVLRRCGSS